jgi:ABC-type branched-subunit amino acid transport system substrate-binding protein
MIYEKRPWALVGGIDGPSTHLAEQVVAKACLALVSPVSTDKSVNLAGVPWMFSCAPDDGQLAPMLVDAILGRLKTSGDQLVLLSVTDHDSRAAAKEILNVFSDRKRLPDFHLECAPGAAELGPQLRALAQAGPRVVLIIANPEDSARLVRGIRGLKLDCELFGTQHLGHETFLKHAGENAERVCFPLLYQARGTSERAREFVEQFVARHGSPPDYAAAYTYDAVRLLVAAIRRGGLNRSRIREALGRLPPWKGVTGPFRWDGTGQNQRKAVGLGIIHDGKAVLHGPKGSR